MLWLAPRKPGTGSSRLNISRAERAIAAGKKDGSWQALDAVEAPMTPDDLIAALAAHAPAAENFDRFPRSAKRAILA